jgi:hypothetical protein
MLAVLLSGFALAALRGPSPTWTVASFHLAIVLLSVAPIVVWARRDESRFLWAAFATAGWVRLLFRWLIQGVSDVTAFAPWRPLVWQIREVIAPLPSLTGQDRTDYMMTCVYMDAILAGLLAAAVCRLALGAGRPPDRREDKAVV